VWDDLPCPGAGPGAGASSFDRTEMGMGVGVGVGVSVATPESQKSLSTGRSLPATQCLSDGDDPVYGSRRGNLPGGAGAYYEDDEFRDELRKAPSLALLLRYRQFTDVEHYVRHGLDFESDFDDTT